MVFLVLRCSVKGCFYENYEHFEPEADDLAATASAFSESR